MFRIKPAIRGDARAPTGVIALTIGVGPRTPRISVVIPAAGH